MVDILHTLPLLPHAESKTQFVIILSPIVKEIKTRCARTDMQVSDNYLKYVDLAFFYCLTKGNTIYDQDTINLSYWLAHL